MDADADTSSSAVTNTPALDIDAGSVSTLIQRT